MEQNATQKTDKPLIKINLGCGERPIAGFLNVDIRDIPGIEYPNTRVEDLSRFQDNYADYVYACHVLEHLPRSMTFRALCEWNRVLKPGGMLRIAVPDWDAVVAYYQETGDFENLLNIVFGGGDSQSNHHYRVFTYSSLKAILAEAGFKRFSRYDWRDTEHAQYDDFSKIYLPHMDFEKGRLMSLNVQCIKHIHVSAPPASKA